MAQRPEKPPLPVLNSAFGAEPLRPVTPGVDSLVRPHRTGGACQPPGTAHSLGAGQPRAAPSIRCLASSRPSVTYQARQAQQRHDRAFPCSVWAISAPDSASNERWLRASLAGRVRQAGFQRQQHACCRPPPVHAPAVAHWPQHVPPADAATFQLFLRRSEGHGRSLMRAVALDCVQRRTIETVTVAEPGSRSGHRWRWGSAPTSGGALQARWAGFLCNVWPSAGSNLASF